MSKTRLKRLKVALDAGQPPPEDIRRWLLAGIRRFERRDSDRPLCSCLGLQAAPFDRQQAHRERNLSLADAACCLAVRPTSEWALAGRLLEIIAAFEADEWACFGHLEEPPDHFDALRCALFRAFATGLPIPRSHRQLRDIIAGMVAAA